MATMTSVTSPAARYCAASSSAGVPWWLYRLFFLSGISGLIYEVVWVRMLTRILGSTVYATSTVLAAFMAGLALGSLLIGLRIDRARKPLLWYAVLELGIGLAALASLALPDRLLPVYRVLYESAGQSRAWLTAGQVVLAFGLLLLPTILMGATLPTLCAYGARRHEGFAPYVANLYALNTLGAVAGALVSGFVLIGEIGETSTILLGVALNFGVAATVLLLRRRSRNESPETLLAQAGVRPLTDGIQPAPIYSARLRRAVAVGFAASGFVALAYEVVWTRMAILLSGTSVYAFTITLAAMLSGMTIGSFLIGKVVDRWRDPLGQLARLQLAAGLALLGVLHLFQHPGAGGLLTAAVTLSPLVLGLFWGACFPVAARCYAGASAGAGRSIGQLYAWNTFGCIAGALGGGFVLIPLLGTGPSAAALAALSLLVGLALFAIHPQGLQLRSRVLEGALLTVGCLLLATVGDPYYQRLRQRIDEMCPQGVTVYRHIDEPAGSTTAFAATRDGRLEKHLMINGQSMTTLVTATKLMAHLPICLTEDPHDVLVICFGMGTTARSASRHDGVRVTAVELVPGVLKCVGSYHADGPELLRQGRVHAVADDGRNFLLLRPQNYDVITMDPAPPLYSAGTVNLYSREFFMLCRERLRPGGAFCLWIPPDRQSEVKLIMRTFLDVFPHVQLWTGPVRELLLNDGFILIGSREPLQRVGEKIRRAYQQPALVTDLTEWSSECDRPEKLLALHVADERSLRGYLAGTPIITDDRPYTEFFLRRSLLNAEYHQVLTASKLRQQLETVKAGESASSSK